MPVFAHHPLAGAPMETFGHGLLSGIGHPILGFDHFFFIVAVGIAAVFTNRSLVAPLFFVGGMLGGIVLIMAGIELPLVELVIALSLVVLGGIILTGKALTYNVAAFLFAGLGLFHGWAFGEALVAQESLFVNVISGYLIGLAVTQWLIAITAGFVVSNIWRSPTSSAIQPRLAGAVVAGVGATFSLEFVESVLFFAV